MNETSYGKVDFKAKKREWDKINALVAVSGIGVSVILIITGLIDLAIEYFLPLLITPLMALVAGYWWYKVNMHRNREYLLMAIGSSFMSLFILNLSLKVTGHINDDLGLGFFLRNYSGLRNL